MFAFKRFLVETFGSPQGLISFLKAYGAPLPGAEAVTKWFSRETVPAKWFAVLVVYLGVDRGATFDLASFLGE